MDVLFLEVDVDILVPELPYVLQAIQCVSGKSADGLGNDPVDFSCHAVVDHYVELLTLLCVGSRNTVISVDTGKFPFRVLGDVLSVVGHLGFITSSLLIAVGTDSAVRCDLELRLFFLLCYSVARTFSRRD